MIRTITSAAVLIQLVLMTASCGSGESSRRKVNGNVSRDSLDVALTTSLDANQLTQSPTGEHVFKLDQNTEDQILALLRRSIAAGESVDERVLAHLKDDLPEQFNDHFMAGNKLYLAGLIEDNPIKQAQGNELVMRWAEYWEGNREEIMEKMYPTN